MESPRGKYFINSLLFSSASDVTLCRYEDQGCIVNSINYILNRYYKGIPESSLNTIDPILVEKVNIIQSPESPVNVRLNFRDMNIFGLKDGRVESVRGFQRNLDGSVIAIRAAIPRLELIGDYTVQGK